MGLIWPLAALIWGFAEATLFFLVPDLLLNTAALRWGWRKALGLCLLAALGAVLGGVVMWRWGVRDPDGARHVLLQIPAVGADLLARVKGEVAAGWALNLARGSFTGAPYKIYAVEAGAAGVDLLAFAAWSFVARLPRFIATTLTAALVQAGVRRWRIPVSPYALMALFWLVDYALYFWRRS